MFPRSLFQKGGKYWPTRVTGNAGEYCCYATQADVKPLIKYLIDLYTNGGAVFKKGCSLIIGCLCE